MMTVKLLLYQVTNASISAIYCNFDVIVQHLINQMHFSHWSHYLGRGHYYSFLTLEFTLVNRLIEFFCRDILEQHNCIYSAIITTKAL